MMTVRESFIAISTAVFTAIGVISFFWQGVWWTMVLAAPLFRKHVKYFCYELWNLSQQQVYKLRGSYVGSISTEE